MPENKKIYELACIISPDVTDDRRNAWLDKITSLVKEQEGVVLDKPYIMDRVLAYPISKKTRGHLAIFRFEAGPSAPETINSEMRHETEILRFMLIEAPPIQKAPLFRTQKTDATAPTLASSIPAESRGDGLEEIDKRIEEILKSTS